MALPSSVAAELRCKIIFPASRSARRRASWRSATRIPRRWKRRSRDTGISVTSTKYEEIVTRDDVQAVIIATPNVSHAPIAQAAIAAGKHVLCEKPLAMNYPEAQVMAEAADAAGVRHMTAFTYRFVPAMRYLGHLIAQGDLGQPYHYRSCRLQDWGTRNLGWRQVKALAATGELGDMLSHRIDFAQHLIGPMKRLVANTKRLVDVRGGQPSDLEDWVAILAEFHTGATGVLESSKLASGRNESARSLDYVELNGSEGTFEFTTGKWNELQYGKLGGPGLAPLAGAARILGLARLPARPVRRRSAHHLPLRPGVRVHRRHPQPAPVRAEFSRRRAHPGGDRRHHAFGGNARVGGPAAGLITRRNQPVTQTANDRAWEPGRCFD